MVNGVWFNDLMICYIERKIIKSLDDVDTIWTFIATRSRKGHLRPNFIKHTIDKLLCFISLILNCTFIDKMMNLFYFDLWLFIYYAACEFAIKILHKLDKFPNFATDLIALETRNKLIFWRYEMQDDIQEDEIFFLVK